MRSNSAIGLLALSSVFFLLSGCGGKTPPAADAKAVNAFGPHDGPIVILPDGGVAEVASEADGGQSRIAVYFYATDALNTPLNPAPSQVRVDLAMPGGQLVPLTLSPATSTDGTALKFVSPAGDYTTDPLTGTLHTTFNGQSSAQMFYGGQN